jgi:hypothetical protein
MPCLLADDILAYPNPLITLPLEDERSCVRVTEPRCAWAFFYCVIENEDTLGEENPSLKNDWSLPLPNAGVSAVAYLPVGFDF